MEKYLVAPHVPSSVSEDLKYYSSFLQTLLHNRGIFAREEAEKFLNPSYETSLHDPYLLHDMEKACVRIYEAIEANEKIIIYGDYDCDGIPGGVILHDFFQKIHPKGDSEILGYRNFENYIPDRHDEGYGLNHEAIEGFIKKDVKLIITVDLGTSDFAEIATAQASGIDVIVTDHHLAKETLPHAFAIVNPKLPIKQADGGEIFYPDTMLCGAGVAFKLVQALIKKYGEYWKIENGWEKWLLDMAGLATLSDMVPLRNENRAIAYFGLKVLQKNRRVGMQKLLRKLNIDARHMAEDDLTFMVTPRLNAASRMDSPMRAFELLATTDESVAGSLAGHLSKINDERKLNVAHIMREVHDLMNKRDEKEIIVIGNPKWRVGVLGLVAGKICDTYSRPAFVWGMEGSETIKGSCRSDGSVNVVTLMQSTTTETFLNFGGHELAGGFSVSHEKVHVLESELSIAMEKGKGTERVITKKDIDMKLSLDQVTMSRYKEIEKLAPFGLGNSKPVFLFENVEITGVKLFGKEKNHLELLLGTEEGRVIKAISFFNTDTSYKITVAVGARINLVASFDLSHFGGRTELRLRIIDIIKA